jgi:hypothetical protein
MSRLAFILALACLLSGSAALLAEGPLFPKDGQDRQLNPAPFALDRKDGDRFTDLREGKLAIGDDVDAYRALLLRAARWHTYRLTLPQPEMNQLVRETHAQVLIGKGLRKDPQQHARQLEFRQAFGKELIKSAREVLAVSARPIVRVNVVRILAGVAETGNEEAADTLVEVMEIAAENDGVKYYAISGLEQLFAQGAFKDAKRETRSIRALLEYITRPVEAPKETDQLEAVRYVRRAAIRALGQTRHATIPSSEGFDGHIAWWLLRISRGEGLTPDPGPAERVEAAIGVCYLYGKTDKDLHLDFVAQQVGATVVEFAQQANKQRAGTTDQYVPCLKSAARLYRALDHLNARAQTGPDKEAAPFVLQVTQRAQPLLFQVGQGQATDPLSLSDWLDSQPAKHKTLSPDSESKLRTVPK